MYEYAPLLAVVFFVAIWNAAVGPSGAVTFVTMATLLPPLAVVPVHAATEAFSAIARSLLLRSYIDWKYCFWFIAGALCGFSIGASTFMNLPLTDDVLRVVLGVAILAVTWIPIPRLAKGLWRQTSAAGGAITSFLTIFIGATSPLVTALIQQRHPDHRKTLGTAAVCMAAQHGGKIIIFGIIGFSFSAYAELLISLFLASIIGGLIGRRILFQVPQDIVRVIFRVIITVLALHLVYAGLASA